MKYIRTLRKIVFNTIWIALTAGILFAVTVAILSKKNEAKITQMAVDQVNQQLQTKISVDNIEISFFSKIPYLSVVFKNVVVWSPDNFNRRDFDNNECEKLLVAEKIYLQFNLFQVLLKNYNISRILIINGEANFLVDNEGKSNYNIFKEKEKNVESEIPQIQLQAVRISNFLINYNSKAKNFLSVAEVKDLSLKGKLMQEDFAVASNISLILKKASYKDISYAENYNVSIKTIMEVKNKVAYINKGLISVNDINFSTSGDVNFKEEPLLNIQLTGRGLNIKSLMNLIPQNFKENFPLDLKGRADIATMLNGKISSIQSPEIKSVYLLSVDGFSYKNLSLSNIQLKGKLFIPGSLSQGKSSFSIEKYRINDANNKFEGSLYITDFSHPELKFKLGGYTELLYINNFLDFKYLKDLTGIIQPDILVETTLKNFREFNLQNILNSQISGSVGLVNTGFVLDENIRIKNLNGDIGFNRNSWQGDLSLLFNESQSQIKVKADYLLNYLFEENQSLWLQADIQSEFLNIDCFSSDTAQNEAGEQKGFFLPGNVYAKLNLGLGEFEYEKFVLHNLKARLDYKPSQIEIVDYFSDGMNGSLVGSALIQQDEKGTFLLGSKSKLNNIDVKNLFRSFENFGQDVIRDEHIKGSLSGDVEFLINADSMLKIDVNSMNMNGQFVLNSGELINFEPAQELSRYINLAELEHIKFSTITNTILIHEQLITIPEMEIKSSAFNINISGTHSFSNYFDYKIKVNLSEILAGKARKSKLENEEHFEVEEDGRRSSLYLSVKGNPDDYSFKYDKKEAVLSIRKDLKEEKNTIKKILNEEFGWFKRDSTSMGTVKENKKETFILDWEEPADSVGLKKIKRDIKNKPVEKEEVLKFEWDDG
ncbi:MAG: AsmA-like C-terminal region-containing protein [Bacteroidales bacterium]|nr:AsmA-like C-terminal region-containing protein [Bacteroidales bacterium]MCF8389648.1 AsmA-like C-terminal region-containing protein [Bacteroidales bacterium]